MYSLDISKTLIIILYLPLKCGSCFITSVVHVFTFRFKVVHTTHES